MSRVVLSVVVVVLATTAPAPAQAQRGQRDAAEMAVARREFQRGMQAAREDRWEDAHDAFSRAYEITGRLRILGNLASAQEQTGRLVQAMESYQRFLAEATGREHQRNRAAVESALEALQPRIPEVQLEIEGLETGDRVLIDGEELSRAVIGVGVPLNPGEHRVVWLRDERELAAESFSVVEGERAEVAVREEPAVEAREESSLAAVPEDEDEESGGVLSSPVFWLVIGAAVLGGLVAAIVLGSEDEPQRQMGTFGMTGRWEI